MHSAACSRGFDNPISPHLQPSKPTWLLSQDIHSQRSRFTKGCAWSMLGAAPKQSPDAGPPAAGCTASSQLDGADQDCKPPSLDFGGPGEGMLTQCNAHCMADMAPLCKWRCCGVRTAVQARFPHCAVPEELLCRSRRSTSDARSETGEGTYLGRQSCGRRARWRGRPSQGGRRTDSTGRPRPGVRRSGGSARSRPAPSAHSSAASPRTCVARIS